MSGRASLGLSSCLLGAVCVWLAVGPQRAHANTAADPTHRYQITLDPGWRAKPVPAASQAPLSGYEHRRSGALLAISRIDYPNLRAWRRSTRERYYEEIEQGVQASAQGYERMRRRATRVGRVPALDLVFRRRGEHGREVVFMRFLFYRRYALTLTVSAPAQAYRRHRRALRKIQHSFKPFFDTGE